MTIAERQTISMTVDEVAEEARISRYLVLKLIAEKKLFAVRAGRRIVVSRTSVTDFLEGAPVGARE